MPDDEKVVISSSPDPAVAAAEAAKEPAPPAKTEAEVTAEMASAIGEKLKIEPAAPAKEASPEQIEAKKVADAKAAADAGAAGETKAAGDADAKKAAADAAAKKVADDEAAKLKGKKADDFALTAQEKKAISSKAQARFHDLHRYAKEQEGIAAKALSDNKVISEARDSILDVFAEYKLEPEDLTTLLEVHLAMVSGRHEDALRWLDENRTAILAKLGREAPGVDLLKDFPDLATEVEEETMTRERALELANARRREQDTHARSREQQDARRAAEAGQARTDAALTGIDKWVNSLVKSDIDYKAKEGKILPRLKQVMNDYPPGLWLPTLQGLYDAIEIVKQPASQAGESPLRPSGARGGDKTPVTMEEAISQAVHIST